MTRRPWTGKSEWRNLPHDHCHCGSRLVNQIYDNTRPLCIDCGYFDEECVCNRRPCEYCGATP